jgi:hypothetical protein
MEQMRKHTLTIVAIRLITDFFWEGQGSGEKVAWGGGDFWKNGLI